MIEEPAYLPPKSDDPKYQAGHYWAVKCTEPPIADILVEQMIKGQVPESSHNVWQYQRMWVIAGPCHVDPFPKVVKTETPGGMTFRHKLIPEASYCDLEDLLESIVNKYMLPIPFGAHADLKQIGGSGIGSGTDVQAHPLEVVDG